MASISPLVAVTGASGYLGSLVIAELVRRGFRVRAALRRVDAVPPQLAALKNVSFVAVPDLLQDTGFAELCQGAAFVHHIASPVFVDLSKELMVEQAVQGTLRCLKAALAAGVQRVVLTASMASVCGSQREKNPAHLWSEADVNDAPGSAYSASKTAAEQAAWAFVNENPALELVTVHPGFVLSPLLADQRPQSTIGAFVAAIDGTDKAKGGLSFSAFGLADGRDVARAHLLAMISPEAKNQRYLVSSCDQTSMLEVVQIAVKHFPQLAATAATAWKDEASNAFVPRKPSTDLSKVEHFFNGRLHSPEQTVIDTVRNLLDSGTVKL